VPIDPAPRRGRRDNGLDAAAYVPLADVDPRVGEHLLDVLKLAGVPAYLEPSADVEPYTRALALPSPPTDRLWVDQEQRTAAREIVEAERAEAQAFPTRPDPGRSDDRPSSGLADLDEERAWEEIVAAFDADVATPAVPPWPVPEDVDDERPPGGRPEPEPTPDRTAATRDDPAAADPTVSAAPPSRASRMPDDAGPDGAPDGRMAGGRPADDEEHYHPPPPPPLPRPSRRTVLGIFLVTVGLLLLFGPRLVGVDARTGFTFGVLAILAGAGVLVLGLRDSRADDGPDDGAVV
jgi:hypothetical protein